MAFLTDFANFVTLYKKTFYFVCYLMYDNYTREQKVGYIKQNSYQFLVEIVYNKSKL